MRGGGEVRKRGMRSVGERERKEREGKQVRAPVRCGCATSRAERGNVMGKVDIQDEDGWLSGAFLHIQGLFCRALCTDLLRLVI